jgi:hypothetical protein
MFRLFSSYRKRLFLYSGLITTICLVASCGSKPIDTRAGIPGDALVYLEARDLGKVADALLSNAAMNAAGARPDTSALNGVSLSVAITGFQASEQAEGNDTAVLDLKPRFVAVAETNAWNYQALRFTESKLGEFVNDAYGGEIELVTTEKHGGRFFVWTAPDGRKAYALVRGSVIIFGNDESALERSAAVLDGQAESIAGNAKITALPGTAVASGYISADGVAQIAGIAGVSLAMAASEEGEVKAFIARVLPQLVRGSVSDVSWVATAESGKMVDRFTFSLGTDVAAVMNETVVPGREPDPDLGKFIPPEFFSTTRYTLADPQISWRSVVLTARTKTDAISGGLIGAFSSSFFEPYGIDDPEVFLSAAGPALQTVRFDPEGEEVAVTGRIRDVEKLKASLAREFALSRPAEKMHNIDILRSGDGELAAAFYEGRFILGEAKSVEKCIAAVASGRSMFSVPMEQSFSTAAAPVATVGVDDESMAKLAEVFWGKRPENAPVGYYLTETRFNLNGMERRTISDLGMIGTLTGWVAKEY